MAHITLANFNMLFIRYFDMLEHDAHYPLGPLYLCRALQNAGLEVDFRDYQLYESDDPFTIDSILDFLNDPAKIIGVSCMANLMPFVILAMKAVKEQYPDRVIILGGVGPKSIESEVLKRFEWIDIVATGEGESMIGPLVRCLDENRDLKKVPGIWYRDENGHIQCNPPAERITDLVSLGRPAFELIDPMLYNGTGLMTSRGCPYTCSFCSVAPIWENRYTLRPIDDVINEMRYLYDSFGVDLFLFQDEFFISSKRRAEAFCNALIHAGLKVEFKAFGRVDLTDRETVSALAQAGCIELRYGIESGCDEILEKTRKGFTAEQALKVIGDAVESIPRVDAFFIWGFPFESMDQFQETVMMMLTMRLLGARILPSMLALLPQTEIYADIGPENLEFAEDLFPEYMITGHETTNVSRVEIKPEHRAYYDFVRLHPDLFPGFFHCNLEGNIRPKLKILQECGFYPTDEPGPETHDSCGAHSPRRESV